MEEPLKLKTYQPKLLTRHKSNRQLDRWAISWLISAVTSLELCIKQPPTWQKFCSTLQLSQTKQHEVESWFNLFSICLTLMHDFNELLLIFSQSYISSVFYWFMTGETKNCCSRKQAMDGPLSKTFILESRLLFIVTERSRRQRVFLSLHFKLLLNDLHLSHAV